MSATSIGLPKLKIAFEKAAQATANRAKKGYVGMIVRDAKAQGLHKLVSDTMIPTELGVDNQALVKLAFEGQRPGTPQPGLSSGDRHRDRGHHRPGGAG